METKTKIILLAIVFISFILWIVLFPGFITMDNAQWAAIILLWLGSLCLERELTTTHPMVELDSFRSDQMKSMGVAAESFTLKDSKGIPWAKFGFHPGDVGQDRPSLTIYDDKGGTVTSFNVTEFGRMLGKIRQEMKKMDRIRKQRGDQILRDLPEE